MTKEERSLAKKLYEEKNFARRQLYKKRYYQINKAKIDRRRRLLRAFRRDMKKRQLPIGFGSKTGFIRSDKKTSDVKTILLGGF